jgi:hypothetical protein
MSDSTETAILASRMCCERVVIGEMVRVVAPEKM